MFICLLQGHPRCRWLCFFSRTQTKILPLQSISHIMAVNGTHGFERKKTYTDKTKLNPAARDDTLRSKDTKQLVCARNWTVFILFLTSDLPHCPTVLSTFTTAGAWRVFFFFLLYGGSQTYKCITATYLSNGPLKLYLQSQLGVSMRDRWW